MNILYENESHEDACPLEGTRHYPCGLMHEDPKECQFRAVCKQMQEDAERFKEVVLRFERKQGESKAGKD